MKKLFCIVFAFVILFGLTACNGNDKGYFNEDFYEEFPTGDEIYTIEVKKNPEVTITLSDDSKIVIELCYDAAPNAVASFLAYAKQDIYESMAFTEVRNSCIVMTDVPAGDFVSPFYTMDETENNPLSHTRGTVSMIRTTGDNTLTGRFFVLTKDQKHFDNSFTAFGKVIEGMEIIDSIAASDVDEDNKIAEPLTIKNVSVKTFGAKIPNPTIILK